MSKQIQALHIIFKLGLNPPFTLKVPFWDKKSKRIFCIHNNNSEIIGLYGSDIKRTYFYPDKMQPCLKKVKQFFNVDTISDEEMYHIAKHLFNWLQDNFQEKVESVKIENESNSKGIFYPNNNINTLN